MPPRKRNKKVQYKVNSPNADAWAMNIGKLMINYSALELELSRWIVHLTERVISDKALQTEMGRTFKEKHKELVKLSHLRSPSEEWRNLALTALQRTKSLAAIRNQVAHSPLLLGWYDTGEKGTPHYMGIPPTPRQRKDGVDQHLSFDELASAVNDTASVTQDLNNILERWRNAYKARNVQLDPSTLPWSIRIRRWFLLPYLKFRGY